MKRRNGKLKLHRETLRNLGEPHLRRALGASPGDTTQLCDKGSDCACPSQTFCGGETFDHTCGTVCEIETHHCTLTC